MAFTGLVLAFFLKPSFERVRDHLHGAPPREEHGPTHALVTGLGLAVVAVCVHSAMGGFFQSGGAEAGLTGPGSAVALSLTLGSSLISSLVTLAWFGRRRGVGVILVSGLATVAPLVAGAILDWSRASSWTPRSLASPSSSSAASVTMGGLPPIFGCRKRASWPAWRPRGSQRPS